MCDHLNQRSCLQNNVATFEFLKNNFYFMCFLTEWKRKPRTDSCVGFHLTNDTSKSQTIVVCLEWALSDFSEIAHVAKQRAKKGRVSERTKRSQPVGVFHSAICLLHLMFHSPSFLLSRLHSPPPQSNWFRSTSWGGYGVGMWAFCFHLSVNFDASKKKRKRLNLDCDLVPRSRRGIHQSWWL